MAKALPQSDLVLLWGTNTLTSNPHLWPFVLEARKNGARIIGIDPIRTRTMEQCDEWLPIRPGTDAALALAMMHVLFEEGLEDRDYLERYTLGARPAARARPRVPARARRPDHGTAGRTHSRAWARVRTRASGVHPRELRTAAPLRRRNGGADDRLPAGRHRALAHGRAVAFSSRRAARSSFNNAALRATRPLAAGSHDQHDPARRGARECRRGRRWPAGARARRLQLQSGGGRAGPERRCSWTRRARISSPSSSSISRPTPRTTPTSCCPRRRSSSTGTCTSRTATVYATLNQPAIEPLGEAKPNTEIFRLIAQRMGMTHPALADDDVTIIKQALDSAARAHAGRDVRRACASEGGCA